MFENRRKSLIQHCEQSELRLHSYIPVKIRDFKSCDFLVKILELLGKIKTNVANSRKKSTILKVVILEVERTKIKKYK